MYKPRWVEVRTFLTNADPVNPDPAKHALRVRSDIRSVRRFVRKSLAAPQKTFLVISLC